MSAAGRARFARAARAVLGPESDRATARAGRLRRSDARPPVSFAELDDVPLWLSEDVEVRKRFISRVGIAAVSPRLRAVIDGTVLRKIAEQVGPDLVDWGLGLSGSEDGAAPLEEVPNVQALGHAVVRHALSPALAAWFSTEESVDEPVAKRAIEQARAAAA